MENKKEKTLPPHFKFTHDHEASQPLEMPSVSRLLEIKKYQQLKDLDVTSGSIPPPPPTQTEGHATASIPLQKNVLHPRILKANRPKESTLSLAIWRESTLTLTTDPLGQVVNSLMNCGATQTVFLAVHKETNVTPPLFVGHAFAGPKEREAVWKGFSWNPGTTPETWNQIVNSGMAELAPTESAPLRCALGAENNEWVTIARVGSTKACRGVLIMFSKTSLRDSIAALRAQLEGTPQKMTMAA